MRELTHGLQCWSTGRALMGVDSASNIDGWESSWYSYGPANSSLYRSFVVSFGEAGFENLDSRMTSLMEMHTAGC